MTGLQMLIVDVELGGILSGVDIAGFFENRYPTASILMIAADRHFRGDVTTRCHATLLAKPFRTRDLVKAVDAASLRARAA